MMTSFEMEVDWQDQISRAAIKSESVLEDMFWHFMRKTRSTASTIDSQVPVGNRRLDALVITANGTRINVELDGKKFHDQRRDTERDMEVINGGHVDEVIRIPFRAMLYFSWATMATLDAWHPGVFTMSLPIFCMSLDEAREDVDKYRQQGMKRDYKDDYEYCDWLRNSTDIYDGRGRVGNWFDFEETRSTASIQRRTRTDYGG